MTRRTVLRIILLALAVPTVVVGVWAEFFPRSFYDDFPGTGRGWVSVDGPFNEHLVRDVGGLNLALGVVLTVAAVTLGSVMVRTAAVAALAFDVPHFVYHLFNLDSLATTSDKVGNVVTLGGAVALSLAALLLAQRSSEQVRKVRG